MPRSPAPPRRFFASLALASQLCWVSARSAAESPSTQRLESAAGPRDALARNPPLYLEVRARVREPLRAPFVPDMRIGTRARIALRVRTSGAAHVYMLHCDAAAALSVFPDAGGIGFRADQWVSLPAADMPIQVGNEPGKEKVYVVATREPLAQSDGRLAQWLARTLEQPGAARCSDTLELVLAGRADTTPDPRARRLPYALRGVDVSSLESSVARAFSERDGVVVLRLGYVVTP